MRFIYMMKTAKTMHTAIRYKSAKLLAALALLLTSPLALAQTSSEDAGYVIYNGSYYLGGTNTTGISSFNPSTCLWTGTSGGKWQNSAGYYLRYNNGLALTDNSNNATNFTAGSSESGTNGQTLYYPYSSWRSYYIRYNNGWSTSRNTQGRILFAVTKEYYAPSSTEPTITATDGTLFESLGSKNFGYTAAQYRPAYYNYKFYNGASHYCLTETSNSTASAPGNETFTYTWSLLNADGTAYTGTNVSVGSDGTVTYVSAFDEPTTLTLRLKAQSTSTSFTKEQSISFKAATRVVYDNVLPEIQSDASSSQLVLPAFSVVDAKGKVLSGKNIDYTQSGCPFNIVDGHLVISALWYSTNAVTASFAGDDDYMASSVVYTILFYDQAALDNVVVAPDIAVTPATATLDLGLSQTYQIPASITVQISSCEACSVLEFEAGKLYYRPADNKIYATPPATSSTSETRALESVTWDYGGGDSYFSADVTGNNLQLSRNTTKAADDLNFTLKATAVYAGSVSRTATAQVQIPFSYSNLSAIYPTTADFSMANGETVALAYTYALADGSGRPYINVSFSSSDNSVATVDANGNISGVNEGTATITVQSKNQDGSNGPSATVTVTVSAGSGTQSDPFRIVSVDGLEKLNSNKSSYFVVAADFDASSFTTTVSNFSGTFDGNFRVVSGLTQPLFASLSGATLRNVVLDDVNISASGNVGAIANEASGATRIYNCGVRATTASTISGTQDVGGIVGQISGNTRVINCYSFADITGGNYKGGIVGRNEATSTTQSNVGSQAMVMNCMFYGDIATGGYVAPVFGGNDISNASNLNTFNYFRYESAYCKNGNITTYNCALAAEERYLTRFEFYRLMLNSNRHLAAWYATGSASNYGDMAKWVLDKSIAPYPVLKPQGIYPSIINFDAENAPVGAERNRGGKLGTLTVNISQGSNAPSGASITTSTLTLNITDKDTANYNYNYYKVQLPYYNQVGTGNYTNNKVVTGWKISVSGGSTSFTTASYDAPHYNFADPKCTEKDNYASSGRVFAQGGYFNVPDGVTSISIEPYWGTAVYLSESTYDLVYSTGYSSSLVSTMGTRYSNGSSYNINGSNQTVYTGLTNAMNALPSSGTVYDNALVLVGNYTLYCGSTANFSSSKAFTVMSADLDMDNEPDNSFIYQHTDRLVFAPIRFDFLNWIGVGMAQKVTGTTQMPNQGIVEPKGWFEITNTCVVRFTEFEYDYSGKSTSPLILLGGIYEQITSSHDGTTTNTSFILLGDNAYFKEFQNGIHSDASSATPHNPISVTGGYYEKFYLTGTFKPAANTNTDNAECYINGGYFGELAGAGQEKLNGNVTFLIDNADIKEFYGGGINEANPIAGNISTTINNSYVEKFCGGPKFGNMATGKTVTTIADGTTFGTYFGAGNGGTSYYRNPTQNKSNAANYSWSTWSSDFSRGSYTSGWGIATNYEYEFFAWAGGNNTQNVGRFYVNYASLSLAKTNNVSSTLSNCTILGDFYGGGNLAQVSGNAVSELSGCTVYGNVFAAGYSAAVPTVTVFNTSAFQTEPSYNGNVGVYNQAVFPASTEYTWSNTGSTSNPFSTSDGNNYIYTSVDLSSLGVVSGTATVTVTGNSHVYGSVFGGGNESQTKGNTTVNVGGTALIETSVYGGGNKADVNAATTVNIQGGQVNDAVYGGGALANTGNTEVNLLGGQVNDVYGGGLGRVASGTETAVAAKVGSTLVNVGSTSGSGSKVLGSVFGCNNQNGTPTDNATVRVYRTVAKGTETSDNPYHIYAVFGGGNKAAYDPEPSLGTSCTKTTSVEVYTCDNWIQYVYGGGNAASAPATHVYIEGGHFDYVFGGGNGKTEEGQPVNMGANVGYYQDTDAADNTSHGAEYGTGKATTEIHDGVINHLFGGSNSRGNIRLAAITELEHGTCDFQIGEAYAAGNEAFMDGEAILNIGCIPGMAVLYGGAKNANINNSVSLTITSGTYGQIFGGNNAGGSINGTIRVNVEETGCLPIVIGEIYGAGNQAAYTTPDGMDGPTVNAYSFTKIGKIFGGGYGAAATVTGDTHVNIQQLKGKYASQIGDSLGIVGEVYGGGNAAAVIGNTNVNIGSVDTVEFYSAEAGQTTQTVLGANIQEVDVTIPKAILGGDNDVVYHGSGNVYGGGNAAEVTGSTNVVIGQ